MVIERSIRALEKSYRSAKGDAKLAFLEEIAKRDNSEAIRLLIGIAEDPRDYDLARIEALKALAYFDVRDRALRVRIGKVLAKLIREEPDDDVRRWSAKSAFPYASEAAAKKALTDAVLDTEEDIDVRYNALSTIERSGPDSTLVPPLESVKDDEELGPSVAALLRSWKRRPAGKRGGAAKR